MRRLLAVACVVAVAAMAPVGAPAANTSACRPDVQRGVIPSWARTGFSDPEPRMPHVLGRRGRIVALVFGYPLLSPPSQTRSNKILWVSRLALRPLADLRIRARRMEGRRLLGRPVTRIVKGGPGPSIIELPSAGCWRLDLTWSGYSDSLDLEYVRRG